MIAFDLRISYAIIIDNPGNCEYYVASHYVYDYFVIVRKHIKNTLDIQPCH